MNSAIVFLPLLGAVLAGLFGRLLGDRGAQLATCVPVTLSAILGWIALFQLAGGRADHSVLVFTWIDSGAFEADWSLRFDALTGVMLAVVGTVSALVHVYSIGYMHGDPGIPRFFSYLSLFTFSMLMLVTADNLLQLFFGWEGVGLCSYLLIGYWYKKPEANAAAIKAFVVNRVGDFGFALGIFGLFYVTGTIALDPVFKAAAEIAKPGHPFHTIQFLSWQVDTITCLALLLFMGACGKSAQFLLHTWLPDAMEGPTPVSALIHAATMVTAGVFMVARLSPVFEYAPLALQVVTFIGVLTAFFAATVGLVQNDIKRVIAYSTCSQLGYMFAACGIGAYTAGIFHLFTHAFFKALLFLGAGSVIHAMHHEQDMRKMGGLARRIPVTYVMMLIGTLALTGVGIPHAIGFAGFHSKDAIIEAAYAAHTPSNYAFWGLVVAAFMTSFYSWRLVFLTFHQRPRWEHGEAHGHDAHAGAHSLDHHKKDDHGHGHGDHTPHESPLVMLIPLAALALGAVVAGFIFSKYFIGEAYKAFWGKSIFEGPGNHILHEMHSVPGWVGWAPFAAMAAGLMLALLYYIVAPVLPAATARAFRPLYLFLLNKWYFDELYDWLLVRPAKAIGRMLWKGGDGAIIDGTIDGTASSVLKTTARVVRLQTGYVYHYAFAMLIGVAFLMTYIYFNSGALR
jgi:NADH-quinone oxidoreductase subunit L